jgi:tRNA A-37 threonylcarbamoyl transferase component Bud32
VSSSPPPRAGRTVLLLRLAEGERADAWRARLAWFDPAAGEILKRDGASLVSADVVDGRAVVFKSRPVGIWDRLRLTLGYAREHRQWVGAAACRAAGAEAARPLALALTDTPDGPRAVLALERLDGPTLLDALATRNATSALAAEVGRLAGLLARAGSHNRDAKPSNWIVRSMVPPRLAMIDTVGVRRGRDDEAMLASMLIEAIGTGVATPPPLRRAALRAFVEVAGGDRRSLWHAVKARIARHGDPTPRVNPLP